MADTACFTSVAGIAAGSSSKSVYIRIVDTLGAPQTGLAYNSAGIIMSYARMGAARVAITPATLSALTSAYSSGGFKEVDATNMPGVYRLDVPNAAFVSGSDFVEVTVWKGAAYHGSVLIPLTKSSTGGVSDNSTTRADN